MQGFKNNGVIDLDLGVICAFGTEYFSESLSL